MANDQTGADQAQWEINTKIRDLEEKQRNLKDRVILIGKNFIETREELDKKILEIKKNLEELNQTTERIKSLVETISGEFSKFARREDVEILSKQAKMFQPLEFVLKSDLEKLKNK
jgi:archaellum component FlaC